MLKVGKSQTLGSILVIKDGAVRIPQREAVSALCRGADKLSFPQKVGRAQGDAVESTGEIVRSISPERVELENPSNGNVRALECRSPE